jgi:hypothetical protein
MMTLAIPWLSNRKKTKIGAVKIYKWYPDVNPNIKESTKTLEEVENTSINFPKR